MHTILSIPKTQVRAIPSTVGIDSLVGNTPLIKLRRVTQGLLPRVEVYAKAEWFNPGGSIKDRPAQNILRSAFEQGQLNSSKRLLDSTSGNMGISYATFGAAMGIPVTLVLPSNASPERIAILKALDAELLLPAPLEGTDGALRLTRELYTKHPERYFYANQYDNPANWQAHYYTTGPEIIQSTNGRITHFIAGMGTSGTMMGVGQYLREYDSSIQLIAVQPDNALHGLEGLKHMPSAIKPEIYQPHLPDRTIKIETEAAFGMVRRLAREEGLFTGISSGAATLAALQVARELDEGIIVTIFPDAGYKYLSVKSLWEAAD